MKLTLEEFISKSINDVETTLTGIYLEEFFDFQSRMKIKFSLFFFSSATVPLRVVSIPGTGTGTRGTSYCVVVSVPYMAVPVRALKKYHTEVMIDDDQGSVAREVRALWTPDDDDWRLTTTTTTHSSFSSSSSGTVRTVPGTCTRYP